jgi:uncharacterized protein YnzC (UPF0291/DUF896 family)
MKWAFSVKNKVKAACLFATLTVLLLLANLISQSNVAALDKTLTSLRNDRLLPVAFAHEINNLLYENKRMLAENGSYVRVKSNLDAIETLAKKYEATDLTPDEAAQWAIFRLQLKSFSLLTNGQEQIALRDVYFTQIQRSLDHLVNIQVAEGSRLMENGKRVVSANVLLSNLVTGLCVVFGLVTLVLVNANYHSLHKPEQQHLLN